MESLLSFYNHSHERIRLIFEQEIDPKFEYHNLRHTLDVLDKVGAIGLAEKIDGTDLLLVKIAALFHDTGFTVSRKNHEEHSVNRFLLEAESHHFSDREREIICDCILATRMPQLPQSALERVLCDADLDYLGRRDFFEIGDALYREMLYAGEIQTDTSWNQLQIKFLENHRYKTNFSIAERTAGLEENLQMLRLGQRKDG